MRLAIGVVVSLSATRFAAAAYDAPSRRVWRRREETPLTPEATVAVIAQLVHDIQAAESMDDSSRVTVCCALEADLDAERKQVVALRNAPGWDDVGLHEMLVQRISAVISLATFTEAAAVAEYDRGAGRGQRSLLYVLPARGVTTCLIEQGHIIEGASGAAGALDQWSARDSRARGAPGADERLATRASAQSIVRAMIGRAAASDESTAAMLRVSGGRAEAMSAAQVVALAADGDPIAQAVIGDATGALAAALAPLSLMLDPGIIVIGGPLAVAPPYYFAALNERLRALMTGATPPLVAPGQLEPNAALIGATILAAGLHA